MTEVIDLLESAERSLRNISVGLSASTNSDITDEAIASIRKAIAKLQAPPRYETPKQYKKRTGKKWNSWDAVYARYVWDYPRWRAMSYSEAQEGGYWTRNCRFEITHIVIATEAGCPPFEWVPEETK